MFLGKLFRIFKFSKKIKNLLSIQEEFLLDSENINLLDAHSFIWIIGAHMKNWFESDSISEEKNYSFKKINKNKRDDIKPFDFPIQEGNNNDIKKKKLRNERLGILSENIVLEREKKYLKDNHKENLSKKVKLVTNNPSLGYDILSYTIEGEEKFIEVKTQGINKSFIITENEIIKSQKLFPKYYIYIVKSPKGNNPLIQELKVKDIINDLKCVPINYRVYY